tara:strand:- start:2763 stop:3008 length:246 start_codon:yes stop_codon:yes gene_type:complete
MTKLTKEYRTDEQYQNIVENAYNGNWSDAMQNAYDGGFWAQDLINKHEEAENLGLETFKDATDLALIVEGTMKIRAQKGEL